MVSQHRVLVMDMLLQAQHQKGSSIKSTLEHGNWNMETEGGSKR